MRVCLLQFAPKMGQVQENLAQATALLNDENVRQGYQLRFDWLILPELAFVGYNFQSPHEIAPHLEPFGQGETADWALYVASHWNCHVTVGYAEAGPDGRGYNSLLTVDGTGKISHNYRKHALTFNDTLWASRGPGSHEGLLDTAHGRVALALGWEINDGFQGDPWLFGTHCLKTDVQYAFVPGAWPEPTFVDKQDPGHPPPEPEGARLNYWIERFSNVKEAKTHQRLFVVLVNRTGADCCVFFAGSSCVLSFLEGEVYMHGRLGKEEEGCLVVDCDAPPKYKANDFTPEPLRKLNHMVAIRGNKSIFGTEAQKDYDEHARAEAARAAKDGQRMGGNHSKRGPSSIVDVI